jgi:hypothetical protein
MSAASSVANAGIMAIRPFRSLLLIIVYSQCLVRNVYGLRLKRNVVD